MKKLLYIVRKRRFKGRYITPDKKEVDDLLEPGTVVDCFENGKHTASYGCVFATEVEPNRQLGYEKKLTDKRGILCLGNG